jgi:hypothetical protein
MTIFSEKKFKLILLTLCVHELTKTEKGEEMFLWEHGLINYTEKQNDVFKKKYL